MSGEKELPQGWVECELGNLTSDISYGYTAKASDQPVGPRMLRITDIQDNRVNWRRVPFCKISEEEKVKYLLKNGDLVFARTGATVGKSFLISGDIPESVYASYLIRVRCSIEAMAGYLSHYFRSPDYWDQITEFSAGIGQPNVNGSKLKGLIVLLAPLSEQKRIADKLDALLARVDACRERLDCVPLILKRFRQAVLAAATSGQLTEEWREDSEIVAPRVEDQEISFPSTWSIYKVGDVLALIDGDRGPNYPKQSDYQESGYCLFLSTKNVREFGFLFDDVIFISEQKHKSLRQGTLERGDVIITTRGTLGNVAVYDETVPYPVVRINSGMLILRKKNTEVLGNFLKIYIASPFFAQQVEEKRSGSAQPQLPAGVLKTFLLPIPPIAEQHEIVRRVEALFAYADRLEARYNTAHARVDGLTPALLAKAFCGELVPQDPNDEPASVLLERIRAVRLEEASKKQGRGQRSAVPGRVPRKKTTMAKSRNDEDVKYRPYLAVLLRVTGGSASVEDLFRRADLPVTDFYKQLAWEVENGHIRDDEAKLEAA